MRILLNYLIYRYDISLLLQICSCRANSIWSRTACKKWSLWYDAYNFLRNVISIEHTASILATFALKRKEEFYAVQLKTYQCIVFANFQLNCVAWWFNVFFLVIWSSERTNRRSHETSGEAFLSCVSPTLLAALSLTRFLSALKLLENRQVTQAKFQYKIIFFSKSQPRIKMFLRLRKSLSKYTKYMSGFMKTVQRWRYKN